MIDDVFVNKVAIIQRCLQRVREEYHSDPTLENQTHQDAAVLNLQRACEAAIDLAMHTVSQRRLGVPQSSREAFSLVCSAGLISETSAERMKAMVGFRNIAVHDYRALQVPVLRKVVTDHLDDFSQFIGELRRSPFHP